MLEVRRKNRIPRNFKFLGIREKADKNKPRQNDSSRIALKYAESDRGAVTILIVALLPIVLLLMGWSIDVGRVLAVKTELYKAGDIAAREMAKRIDMEEASAAGTQKRELSDAAARELVEGNLDGLAGGQLRDVFVVENGANVEVSCTADVPLLFCGIIGRTNETVSATGLGRIKTFVPVNGH